MPVAYPYLLELDYLWHRMMPIISDCTATVNVVDVATRIFARCSWYCYFLPFEIHVSLENYLNSNHKRFLERLKLLRKRQKLIRKSQKVGLCEYVTQKNALVAKLDKTESSPLTIFYQMTLFSKLQVLLRVLTNFGLHYSMVWNGKK